MSLERLAARYGVARSYRNDRGERVDVARDTIVAVLEALGVDTSGRGWIARELAAFDEAAAARLVEPVLVAWDGVLPPSALGTSVRDAGIVLEDGDRRDGIGALGAPDARLPFGYHRLVVSDGARDAHALVISAPRQAWRPRGRARHFGVYAPVFALHRDGEPAPGHLAHLSQLLDWVVTHGGDTLLTLPLLAAFLDEPQEISPYSPISRVMWNELYATLERALPAPDASQTDIDYVRAAAATRDAIREALRQVDHDPIASGDLMRFLAARPDVVDYARFRAAQQRFGRDWRRWPERLRDGTIDAPDVDPREVRYHCVAQWLVDRQLAALATRARDHQLLLGLDLPLGTHPDGFDVWRHRDLFASTANAGAPPDSFFVGGQDWGFPPAIPTVARATGHDFFHRAIAHHLRHATMLRIDHVMGLERLYWVPRGAPPTSGTYVRYPAEEQFAIVCLESHRAQALIVGEDLGTVPPSIRRAMRRHGITGTWVAQGVLGQLLERGDYVRPPRHTVASLNTHDMPTFAGFLAGTDVDDRVALGLIDDATGRREHRERTVVVGAARSHVGARDDHELLEGLVEEIGSSDASIVLVGLDDLWLDPRPHNVPGTSTERPNWRKPLAHGIDVLDEVPRVAATMERLRTARERSRDGRRRRTRTS
ncbi:MAG TPA: 4-alpha-glucanotransferase [Acidimicrobiales bacterium]